MSKKTESAAPDSVDGAADPAVAAVGPATVTQAFEGVPDGLVYPKAFSPGDIVDGDLADVAVREGWAERA